ncbi:MAG: pantoate--beta-alanine ligase [Legionellales bacterium RIFCSPHIGHO2_12_FULL_37_14]|nr:MAG: pantoate--beta-alanine ligase [Legionellales bacterium RIFCSPHIGHO2_12_FULL_37_14]
MTEIIRDLKVFKELRESWPKTKTLGFVPTMGNLHNGHLSLCRKSQQENAKTCVSIFVNPKQFNQKADFINYPKTLDADLKILSSHKVDYCILPSEELLYHDNYTYRISEHHKANLLEGLKRPLHFTGVLTVVMKLFNLVKPTCAYFGEKDYQQYELINGMVQAFFMDIKIKLCPTVREEKGLACSSRNSRLSIEQKTQAATFAQIFHQVDKSVDEIILELQDANIKVDYIEKHNNRLYAAVFIGDVRLIDNYELCKS